MAEFILPLTLMGVGPGVALVTSIMGTLWLDRMDAELAVRPFLQRGLNYAQALKNGNETELKPFSRRCRPTPPSW